MSFSDFIATIPDFAKDIRINTSNLLSNFDFLSQKQVAMVALSCAVTLKNSRLADALSDFAVESGLTDVEINAAKGCGAIMTMNNVYYRFTHSISNEIYSSMQAGLRMQIMINHGISKLDFELCSLAVSAINGCVYCINSHEKSVEEHGATNQQIQNAIKIAAVLSAVSAVL
jgi:alkyl hydroperoxide reductase subunit D